MGSQPSLAPRKYCSTKAYTKLGTETNSMTRVEMVWSCQRFFFRAAAMPSRMPSGTEKSSAYTLIRMVGSSLS